MIAVRYSYLVDNTAVRAGSRVAAAGGAERVFEPLPFAFLQTRRSPTELQPPARSADYGHQLTLRQARAVA